MTAYSDQIAAARQAHFSATALDQASRTRISSLFEAWSNGRFSDRELKNRLEDIVTSAYKSSTSVAVELAKQQSGLDNWKIKPQVNSDILKNLVADVRSNLKDFLAADKSEVALRRVVFRTQLSAAVAAQRGFTDGQLKAYSELETRFKYELVKVWIANFVDNEPCPVCTALHGTQIGVDESFPKPEGSGKVYGDLLGPPRHPNCRCYIVVLISDLSNVGDTIDVDSVDYENLTISTDDVKNMSSSFFLNLVASLKKLVEFFRRKR